MVHYAAFLVSVIETGRFAVGGRGRIGRIWTGCMQSVWIVCSTIVVGHVRVLGARQGLGSGSGQRAEILIRVGWVLRWVLAGRKHSRRAKGVED